MSGWIKLHRAIFDWEWFTDVPVYKLFTYLLLAANYEDNTYRGMVIRRGCLITGRRDLSVKTGLTENQVRYALDKLRSTNGSTNELIITSTPQGTHIQIVKYDEYQNNHEMPPTYQPANQPANQPLYKKNKNKRSKEAVAPAQTEHNFTNEKSQVEAFRDGTSERWHEFTSLWQTTEDPSILHKNTRKKYWNNLSVEIQNSLITMIKNLGSDVKYLKTVWISECFKNKTMNSAFLKEKIVYQKSKLNTRIDKANKDTTHNFSGQYE